MYQLEGQYGFITAQTTYSADGFSCTYSQLDFADNFRVVDYKGKEDGGRIEKDDQGKNIREIPRFELEDKTTGNGSIVVTTDNNAGEDYWSQFWMKVCDEPMAEGATPLALSFRIRADRAQTIATQGHGVDWEYNNASNGYLGFGKLDVTTEWQKVTLKVEAGNGHPTNFVSVVLNLSEKNGTSNNFYIDDVQVEEYKADWYYAQEIRAKDYLDPAATYTDTDTPHPLANYVAEGGYVQVVSNASPSQPYNSQIWIQIPDEWVGKTTKMTFEVMADQVVSAPESYQATATGKGWGANAAPSASAKLEITEQDKWITIERILNTENVKSNAGAPYSSRQVDQYCVDLSNNADPITYKFRNVKFEEYVPTYAITITEAENGSVSANVTEAAEGYELDALSVAAGETPVEVADDNSFTMPAAAVTVTATFKAVESGEEEYLPKPETDPDYADFEEIAQDQGKDLDTFARTAVEEGADFNTYTASGDLQVAFKMYDIDVAGCDYVTVKFAQPAPKGWNIAFWAQGGTDNVEIPEGATEYKYVFADDAKCAIKDDVLPQICVLTLWPGGYPFDMKVYGIYKHKVATVEDTDLTKEMFFTWDGVGADAEATAQAGCAYDINTSSGMPYGDGTVNEYNYADLSAYDHLAITATEGEPRLLFNRAAQDDHQGPLSVELPRDKGQNKYEAVVENTDGSKTYVINLKEIVAKDGYAHLHAIKGANWANTTVTEMKLFAGSSQYTDVLTNIFEVADDAAVKDGKYFINGQIVIVKNGVKYNAAGLPIE